MLINYVTIALRNLFKYKIFSFINIAGMSISLASVLVIALFVHDELSYDQHISNVDRKFRVYDISTLDDGQVNTLAITPYPFATYLQKDYPEIESTLRIMDSGENLFEIGDKKIQEPAGIFAEPTVVDMFSLELLSGDAKTILEKPVSVILKKSLAEKYFGAEDPVGKTIKISKEDYTVTGVFADPPQHFHLKINYVLSFTTLTRNFAPQRYENWQFQQYGTYIKVKPNVNANELEAKLPDFAARYAHPKTKPEGLSYIPHLQSISDIHLHSADFQWDLAQRGNAQSVYILTFAGALILIIACLNFINLSTARSMKRMKEVGVRKVVGALRTQLIFQFITESILIAFIGLAFAIAITELTLPLLNTFTEKNISDPFNIMTISFLIAGSILLGCL
ncbi:MAG TPA: ABC transporter permease, partial [Cyclobacteriaceae bacterium]